MVFRRGHAIHARWPAASARDGALAACKCQRSRSASSRRAARATRTWRSMAAIAARPLASPRCDRRPLRWWPPCLPRTPANGRAAPPHRSRRGRRSAFVERLERAIDNAHGARCLFGCKDQRRVNTHARRITHQDEPAGQALLEELDTARFVQKVRRKASTRSVVCRGRLWPDQIEADQQPLAANVRDRSTTGLQRAKAVEQDTADAGGIVHEVLITNRLNGDKRRGCGEWIAAVTGRRRARE